MRRLPVYFLVDVSESMVGGSILQVQESMKAIVQELRTDPYALETVYISVIAFADKATKLLPLTELEDFTPPTFSIGEGRALGNALEFLMNDMDNAIVKADIEQKGDWNPIIFLFTDGTSTDDPSATIARWNQNYRQRANIVAISIGDANTKVLGLISDNIVMLSAMDDNIIKSFFMIKEPVLYNGGTNVIMADEWGELPSLTSINIVI